ncbi:MAG: biosynthetic-type acetolactate synthase large subunit [Candidatus Tectomicrobia bacterium]|uniref:Acetolactate synthase n=1 Tax=Tectimicrobiota bacterium TaxID=2528274 RepID=A0A932ZVW5_UNCTE|nr:biosynthetic-type acetolactate synthase large subunit [Candidatus Tectomicrobia bacterium]
MEMTGAQIAIEELKAGGVEIAFGIPGGAIMPFYDDLLKANFKHILTRHEQGAAHMADGYARVSGKVALVVATSGPGATNLITGLLTAQMDSVPLIAVTGQVSTPMIGTDAFQEADIYGCSIPVTKYNWLIKDVRQIQGVIREAVRVATGGRPGPVLVDIPKDIQTARTEYNPQAPVRGPLPAVRQMPEPDAKAIEKLIEAMERAERPVILAGAGIIKAGASAELAQFARHAQIPVINTLLGMGGFPGTDPLFLGMPGMHGTAYANFALCECDLLINLGARFDDRVTGKVSSFCLKAVIVHVDIDAAEIGKRVKTHIPILGNVRDVLRSLNQQVRPVERRAWIGQVEAWKRDYPLQYGWDGSVKPQYVIEQIQEITGGDALFATGVGQHQMWAAQFLRFNEPRAFVSSGGLGTMGFGLPASIGAKFGRPDKEVWLIDGDGSFAMTLVELATAAMYNVPVRAVILNNAFLGMVRQWQELFFGKRYSHSHYPTNPNFAKIAEGYGVKGFSVRDVDQVRSVLEQAADHDGPVVMDFHVNPEENVWPMVPAGAGNDEMQLAPPAPESAR